MRRDVAEDVSINTDDVWIIIPAFNEGSVIGGVVTELRTTFENVVCVDDGSRDATSTAALEAGANVVRHTVNLGQGAAIQTGIEYARNQPDSDVFVTFDADGQHQVADVVKMISRLRKGDVDIVMGTRFSQTNATKVPLLKRVILRTAVRLSPKSQRLGLTDAHNGLRVFSKEVANNVNLTMNGMSHAGEFVDLIIANGWRTAEEPVEILYTEYSMSKGQPLLNGINILFDGFIHGRMRR